MPRPRLPYLQKETTRHGRLIWYVRLGRGPRTRIHGAYGDADFIRQYKMAISGAIHDRPAGKNTLTWLIDRYKKSSAWTELSPGSRRQRDNYFYHLRESAGTVPYRAIRKQNIIAGMDRRRATPAAANTFLKAVRGLFKWACDAEYIRENPTDGIKKIRYKTDGFPAWTLDDLSAFRARWDIGTRERLAMELLLATGLRRGDVVRLGRQHIRDGVATLKAEKTGATLYLTIWPELTRIIDQSPTGDMAFIATEAGNPRKKEAFGNWFRAACRKATISKSAHGLRKLAATLLAEAGGTEKELQAAFGWTSESQSKIYTQAADRKHLAMTAATKRNQNPIPVPNFTLPNHKKNGGKTKA